MFDLPVETVIGISTDKACKPVSVMGMTKAIQERIFTAAALQYRRTRFVCVRYGNVLASAGSVIPLFLQQIAHGGPVTLTDPHMTRFLLSLETAVDTVWSAYRDGASGEIWVPIVAASKIHTVAQALIGDRDIDIEVVGIRPGEKVHEILVAEDEALRTSRQGDYWVIRSILPELASGKPDAPALAREYCSKDSVMSLEQTRALLSASGLI
jgi:UDP-glucose 4-epimerase